MPERPKGADCKSAGIAFGGSNPSPGTISGERRWGVSVLGTKYSVLARLLSSVAEHFHGKEGVPGSNPGGGSGSERLVMRVSWRRAAQISSRTEGPTRNCEVQMVSLKRHHQTAA
jgi:hypothetical protein